MDRTKKFNINIGYLIARKISLSILRMNANIKKGMDTNVAVEAKGSLFWSAIINANIINIKAIKRVVFFPNTIGNVLSPEDESPFISGNVVSRETEEKHRP